MPQHASPPETTSSFQMPAELSFTNSEQRTPEFVSTQPEFGHGNSASTPLAGPLLNPTHNQFVEPSPFPETSPTNHLRAVSSVHAQADPAFTGWSPAFQQNMFSPVNYSNGAGRQMPPRMVYPSYGPYSSPQGVPQPFAIPERPLRDFRTCSLSHPHTVHCRDGYNVKPGM